MFGVRFFKVKFDCGAAGDLGFPVCREAKLARLKISLHRLSPIRVIDMLQEAICDLMSDRDRRALDFIACVKPDESGNGVKVIAKICWHNWFCVRRRLYLAYRKLIIPANLLC